jgi:hypothetical protein
MSLAKCFRLRVGDDAEGPLSRTGRRGASEV